MPSVTLRNDSTDRLTEALSSLLSRFEQGYGARQLLERQLEEALDRAAQERAEAELLEHVVSLLSAMQELWRERFQAGVGEVVSRGLTAAFGEPLDLVVEMGQSGDLPVAKFSIRDSRGLATDIIDARGGGLVNVASFLLRVLLLLSARPPLARLLVLDEAFANVSAEYLSAVVALLRRICDEGAFQVILVTHRDELADAADVAYRFELDGAGATQVTALTSERELAAQAGI